MYQQSSYPPNDNEVGLETVEPGIRVDKDEAVVDPVEVVAHTRTHETGDDQAEVTDARWQDVPVSDVCTEDIPWAMERGDVYTDRNESSATDSETSSLCSMYTAARFSARAELADLLEPSVHDQAFGAPPLNDILSTTPRIRRCTMPDNAELPFNCSSLNPPAPASDDQPALPPRDHLRTNPCPKETAVPFTIVFNNTLYNDDKNMIIQWPAKSNNWYIVPCRQCGLNWGANPLAAARKHVRGSAHELKGKDEDVIQALGITVLDCTRERAHKNNDTYEKLLNDGTYVPETRLREKKTRKSAGRGSISAARGAAGSEGGHWRPRPGGGDEDVDDHNREVKILGSLHKELAELRQSPPDEIIWDPVIGEVYQYPWESSLGDEEPVKWMYVTRLPLNYAEIAATGYLLGSDLWVTHRPDSCCTQVADGQGRASFAWQKGFEFGGDRVRERKVPLFFFQAGQDIPPANEDFLIHDNATCWGEVVYLRPENHLHPVEHDTKCLEDCRRMVGAFKERRATQMSKMMVDGDHFGQPGTQIQATLSGAIHTEANLVSRGSHL